MGYNLYIGEAVLNYDNDSDYPSVYIDVKLEQHDNAPAFGEPSDYTNSRYPSYTVWSDFCKFVGLYDLFYDEDYGLCRPHPGETPLTTKHKEAIDKAYSDFKNKYPNSVATYGEKQENWYDSDENNPEENGYLCRLEWLKYWIDWALENCEKPIFKNS